MSSASLMIRWLTWDQPPKRYKCLPEVETGRACPNIVANSESTARQRASVLPALFDSREHRAFRSSSNHGRPALESNREERGGGMFSVELPKR